MAVLTQSKRETVTSKKILNNQPTQEAQWLAGSDPQSPEGPCSLLTRSCSHRSDEGVSLWRDAQFSRTQGTER